MNARKLQAYASLAEVVSFAMPPHPIQVAGIGPREAHFVDH